jgi:hypothetical protein
MSLKEQLIKSADRFCKEHGISRARLATIVVNDGKFFRLLEEGRDCTINSYERFIDVFKNQKAWEAAKSADRERRSKPAA